MKIVKSIDCVGTNLDIYDGPVGIMVSGGVDSAILLYYLMKYSLNTIHIYTTGSNKKFRRNSIIAPRVVEKCIQLTGNNNVVHHIHYDESATDNSMCIAPQKDIDNSLINIVYDGTTMNPPYDIAINLVATVSKTNSDGTVSQHTVSPDMSRSDTGDNVMWYNDDKFYMPWANTNKKGIAKMYKNAWKWGHHYSSIDKTLVESLLPVTRSCEWDPTCDYYDVIGAVDPYLEHCGECWWCKEREWGFK